MKPSPKAEIQEISRICSFSRRDIQVINYQELFMNLKYMIYMKYDFEAKEDTNSKSISYKHLIQDDRLSILFHFLRNFRIQSNNYALLENIQMKTNNQYSNYFYFDYFKQCIIFYQPKIMTQIKIELIKSLKQPNSYFDLPYSSILTGKRVRQPNALSPTCYNNAESSQQLIQSANRLADKEQINKPIHQELFLNLIQINLRGKTGYQGLQFNDFGCIHINNVFVFQNKSIMNFLALLFKGAIKQRYIQIILLLIYQNYLFSESIQFEISVLLINNFFYLQDYLISFLDQANSINQQILFQLTKLQNKIERYHLINSTTNLFLSSIDKIYERQLIQENFYDIPFFLSSVAQSYNSLDQLAEMKLNFKIIPILNLRKKLLKVNKIKIDLVIGNQAYNLKIKMLNAQNKNLIYHGNQLINLYNCNQMLNPYIQQEVKLTIYQDDILINNYLLFKQSQQYQRNSKGIMNEIIQNEKFQSKYYRFEKKQHLLHKEKEQELIKNIQTNQLIKNIKNNNDLRLEESLQLVGKFQEFESSIEKNTFKQQLNIQLKFQKETNNIKQEKKLVDVFEKQYKSCFHLSSSQNKFIFKKDLLSRLKQRSYLNSNLSKFEDQKISIKKFQNTTQQKENDMRILLNNVKNIQGFNFKRFQNIFQTKSHLKVLLKDSQNQNKILGGGGSCGSLFANKKNKVGLEKKIKKWLEKEQDFMSKYLYFNNESRIKIIVENKQFPSEVKKIADDCINQNKEIIVVQNFKDKFLNIFNLIIHYSVCCLNRKCEKNLQKDIDKLINKLKEVQEYLEENKNTYKCLDLYICIDFLIILNKQRQSLLDKLNEPIFMKIAEFTQQLIKIAPCMYSIAGVVNIPSSLSEHKNLFQDLYKVMTKSQQPILEGGEVIDNLNEGNKSGKLFQQIAAIWLSKYQSFQNEFINIPIHEELLFYIDILNKTNLSNEDIIKYIYVQINFLLEKDLLIKNDNFRTISEEIQKVNKVQQILFFVEELQKNNFSNKQKDFVQSMVNLITNNPSFRFLQNSILLKLLNVITHFGEKQVIQSTLINLCYSYLSEKEESILILFKDYQIISAFIQDILKTPELQEQIIKEKKIIRSQLTKYVNEEEVNKIQENIEDIKDIETQVFKNTIRMLEIDQRQKLNNHLITHKDDILLDATKLYINQQITHLAGKNIFQDHHSSDHYKNQNIQQQGNSYKSQAYNITIIEDALKAIINSFLIPNYQDPSGKITNQGNGMNQQCKILSILAEGGMGKSILLKRLENELISKNNSEYINDERANFIPLIVKCSSLDMQDPSIDDYLISQKFCLQAINILKKSQRNKLIMLDGYEEYTGSYFKVYEQLKLYEWVNVLVIVTSRLENISVSDAEIYFNYYDKNGSKVEGDKAFSIVKLMTFKQEDIQNYFEKFRDEQIEQKLIIFQKEKYENIANICLKNNKLIQFLKLPLNIFFLSRMISDIDIDNENKIQNILKSVPDQIELLEELFLMKFEIKALQFISNIKEITEINQSKIKELVQSSYFEYFQFIAMEMFLNKGKKGNQNFLQVDKQAIQQNFQLRQVVKNNLTNQQQQLLLKNINEYVDQIEIISQNYVNKEENSLKNLEVNQTKDTKIEFRHKSLFEYFAARAMKFDFDIHKENIYNIPINVLLNFNINKKIIMSCDLNQSEQQILFKLFKLISRDKIADYTQNYSQDKVEQTNRYIQYIKMSTINSPSDISKIDTGASNLISALFISKFSFENLNLIQCSFSKAYFQDKRGLNVNFDRCNLCNAQLNGINPSNVKTSNIQQSNIDSYQNEYTQEITSTIFSADSKYFVTGSSDNSFKIWNAEKDFQLINTIQGHTQMVTSVAFSTDDKFLATGSNDSTCKIWNVGQGFQLFSTIQGHTQAITSVAFSADSKYLATGSKDNTIKIWDLEKGFKLFNTILGHTDIIFSVAFSADGKYLATGSKDKTCKIWDAIQNFEVINSIKAHTELVSTVAFSPNGKYLATGSQDNTCKLWNTEKGFELIITIQEHTKGICFVAFSANSKYLSTCSLDNSCKIWSVEKGFELINTITGHSNLINSIAFSADGKYLATNSNDKTCKIWNAKKAFETINIIQGNNQKITSVAFSTDGNYLATSLEDYTCKILNANNGQFIQTIQGHTNWISSAAFSADSKYLATGSCDNTCKIWNAEKGFQLINTIEGDTYMITSVAFSPDGKYLATGSCDKTCKIWNQKRGFELTNTIKGHTQAISSIAFSVDGKYLATGSQDNTCKIWNEEKGFQLIHTIQGHTSWICALAFSADCKYLASGSGDSICKIWNSEIGFELIQTIQGRTGRITSVSFLQEEKQETMDSVNPQLRLQISYTDTYLTKQMQVFKCQFII